MRPKKVKKKANNALMSLLLLWSNDTKLYWRSSENSVEHISKLPDDDAGTFILLVPGEFILLVPCLIG